MWRTPDERAESAARRLDLATCLWGWHPHARQRDFFCDPSQIRVAACGRRWGKTEALSVDLATLALEEAGAGRGCRQLVVAPTDAQARLIGGETLARLLSAQGRDGWPPALRLHTARDPHLRLTLHPEGTDPRAPTADKPDALGAGDGVARLWFRSAGRDGRGLRGLWAHRIVADEAAYVPDAVLTDVLLPMLTDVGGEFVLASSPAGRGGVFYRLYARGEASPGVPDAHGLSVAACQCPSTENPHLDAAFLAAMREELGEARFAQEYLAQFVDDYGAVFRPDDIDACLQDDPRVTPSGGDLVSAPRAGRCYSMGVDWGRRQDWTVVCVLDATERPARLVGLWRMQGTGWEVQAARVGRVAADFAPRKVLCDGSGVGDAVAERLAVAVRGCVPDGERVPPVERFVFTGENKLTLVDRLTVALSDRALRFPPHAALLRELHAYEYQGRTATGRFRTAAAGSGHDDIVMALALAWVSAPPGPPPAPADVLLLASRL